MSIADEIAKLEELHRSGALSDREFADAKNKLIHPVGSAFSGWSGGSALDGEVAEQRTRTWAMLVHLSQLLGYTALPVLGLAAPILIWQLMKGSLPGIDEHGKIVVNWMISSFIYLVIFAILSIVFVGIPFLIALLIAMVVFPIIGGLKANNGEAWKYPLSITFFE